MDRQQQENIIEDLLYESSARQTLVRLGKRKKQSIRRIFSVAASLILIVSLGLGLFFNNSNELQDAIDEAYVFPSFNKSRSGIKNVTDDLQGELKNEKFNLVLDKLEKGKLSQQDLIVKANILYKLDRNEKALQIIETTDWEDSFLYQESKWLEFLIKLENGSDLSTLELIKIELKNTDKVKATNLLKIYKK